MEELILVVLPFFVFRRFTNLSPLGNIKDIRFYSIYLFLMVEWPIKQKLRQKLMYMKDSI